MNDVAKRWYSPTTLSRSAKTSSAGALPALALPEFGLGDHLVVIVSYDAPGPRSYHGSPRLIQTVERQSAQLAQAGRQAKCASATVPGSRPRCTTPPGAPTAPSGSSQRRGRPWLMSVNTFEPHDPFDPRLSCQQRYLDRDLPEARYATRVDYPE